VTAYLKHAFDRIGILEGTQYFIKSNTRYMAYFFGTFAQNFCFILENKKLASELIKCGSRVVHKVFNKTIQKPSETLSRGPPRHL